ADKAAKATGMARRTLEKAEAIVDAAEAEPERFGKLKDDMDCTGRVNGVYHRLKIAKQAELIRAEPPPLPGNGPYRVGVIDPAWPYALRDEDPSHRGVRDYPSQSIAEIRELPVASLMHDDSILFVWVTNFVLVQGIHTGIIRAWGFEPKTLITWPKEKMGNGELVAEQDRACRHGRARQACRAVRQSNDIARRTISFGAKERALGKAARVL